MSKEHWNHKVDPVSPIRDKIRRAQDLLCEVERELASLQELIPIRRKAATRQDVLPPPDDLKREYDQLYGQFAARDFDAIGQFIASKSKTYLEAFCRVNSLPLDGFKASKATITEEIKKWFAQREAIGKPARIKPQP
jgi:hypothetical protein